MRRLGGGARREARLVGPRARIANERPERAAAVGHCAFFVSPTGPRRVPLPSAVSVCSVLDCTYTGGGWTRRGGTCTYARVSRVVAGYYRSERSPHDRIPSPTSTAASSHRGPVSQGERETDMCIYRDRRSYLFTPVRLLAFLALV